MKKMFLSLSLVAGLLSFSSCEKAKNLLFKPFESPLNVDFNINPVSNTTTSATLGSTTVNYDLNAEVKRETDNAFDGSIIGSMYLNKVAITLSNTDATNNLSNFETVSLSVSTGSATPVVIGPFTVPSGATNSAEFTVANSPNVRQFFNGSSVNFSLIGKARTATTKVLPARVSATIKFDK